MLQDGTVFDEANIILKQRLSRSLNREKTENGTKTGRIFYILHFTGKTSAIDI